MARSRYGSGWPLNRRDFLKTTVAGGAALMLPLGFGARTAYGGESPALDHFIDPLPIPRIFNPSPDGSYVIATQQLQHELHSHIGPMTTVWGYGDSEGAAFPGPTFEVRNGTLARVRWQNQLANDPAASHFLEIDPSVLGAVHGAEDNRKMVVHLHGGHITQAADGYPEDTLLPGQEAVYDYLIDQDAATLWYHDHALGNTRLNVYMGLAGFFLVRDGFEDNLIATGQLPGKAHEIPLVLQDRRLNKVGGLAYGSQFDDSFFGDVMVVNGKAWPYMQVEPRQYRFRVLNGSNSRSYTLQLGVDMLPFKIIGTDQGLLPAPLTVSSVTLTPGERADLVIDFRAGGLASGDDITLLNTHPSRHGEKVDETPIRDVMQFRIFGSASDEVVLPGELRPITRIDAAEAVTERNFKLEDKYDPRVDDSEWFINNRHWHEITDVVKNGTVEIWNWVNKSEMVHPMHIHLVKFQVVGRYRLRENRKGKLVPGVNLGLDPHETGWKDTVRVGPHEFVQVIARFDGRATGLSEELFPFHCHILEHEDHEMMRQFRLVYG